MNVFGTAKNVLLMTAGAPAGAPFSTTEKRPPLGLGFLASALRNDGHNVFFIDNYLKPEDLSDGEYLRKHEIDVVGMYISTICMRHALRQVHALHALRLRGLWHGRIVVGGPHTTVALETIPDFVDHVVQGEGEGVICGIVDGSIPDRVVRGERIKDLDTLPAPAWDLFVGKDYNWSGEFFTRTPVFTMNTSRGCPFRCRFCAVNSIWGREITYFSPERIVDDLQKLIDDYGCQGVYFREDNFTANKKRLFRFCDLVVQRNIDIEWACESKVTSIDAETMRRMVDAGLCGLFLGVESGSQRMLDYMKKDIALEHTYEAFRLAHKYGVRTAASMVVGAPTETPEELQATYDLIDRIRPTVTWYNVFTGVPESDLYRETLENKLYDFIDDRGLVYLNGHDERVKHFYKGRWGAMIPVSDEPKATVVLDGAAPLPDTGRLPYPLHRQSMTDFETLAPSSLKNEQIEDPRIRFLRAPHPTDVEQLLARAAKEARSDCILLARPDVVLQPHGLEALMETLSEADEANAATGAAYVANEDGEPGIREKAVEQSGTVLDLLATGLALVRTEAAIRGEVAKLAVNRLPVFETLTIGRTV